MKSKAYHSYLIKAFFLSDVSCDQKPFVTKSTYFVFKTKVLQVIESQLGTHLFIRKTAFICCWLSSIFGETLHRQRTRWVKTFGTTWTDLIDAGTWSTSFLFSVSNQPKIDTQKQGWMRLVEMAHFNVLSVRRLPIQVND